MTVDNRRECLKKARTRSVHSGGDSATVAAHVRFGICFKILPGPLRVNEQVEFGRKAANVAVTD